MRVTKAMLDIPPLGTVAAAILLIEKQDLDSATKCENCLKPMWTHPRLAVPINRDWCLDCNDREQMRRETPAQVMAWTVEQVIRGNILTIATDFDPSELIILETYHDNLEEDDTDV